MGHAPATIVILAWNEWPATRACLESLRPTLGPRDQVVVVDNGSVDETPDGLRRYRWVEVVTNAENRGFAGGCNDGAARARNDVIVFLNNDTLVPSRWLEGLLRPFGDESVVATGPRSNEVSGAQLVPSALYDASRVGELQRFARAWRDEHRGQQTDVTRLVGFCLAVRRSAFERVGGFDEGFGLGGFEDDDLCTRLRATGGRLVIAHESFVHHVGHVTFDGNSVDWEEVQHLNRVRYEDKHKRGIDPDAHVLLSACMIVKDEEELLPDCLASLADVVDEVVVYDTGSSDRTVEIAKAAGAVVVSGHWDDDFARARNASLDACSGQWILHIDADERLEGDGAALRAALGDGAVDQYNVRIDNVAPDGVGVAFAHHATRLFRRARGLWVGRLHEQIVPRPGQSKLRQATLTGASLLHLGYRADIVADRDKLARNVRVAEAEVAGGAAHPAHAVLSLGRALSAAGHPHEALARFVEARDLSRDEPGVHRQALRNGAQTLLDLGRPDEALPWIERLAQLPGSSAMAGFLHGLALLNLGDHATALTAMSEIDDRSLADHDGYEIPVSALALNRGLCLLGEQRWADAAQTLRPLLADGEARIPVWGPVVDATSRAGADVRELAALVRPEELTSVLGQLLTADAGPAEAVADALWRRLPGAAPLLAYAGMAAHDVGVERAMEWSARLREAGLPLRCPLVRLAESPASPWLQRVQASAVLLGFGDDRGVDVLRSVASDLPVDVLPAALVEVATLAPEALGAFVEAAAHGPHRCLVLAQSLHELGAHQEALAVFEHGWAQPGPRDEAVVGRATAWLREVGHEERAQALAS